MTNQREHEVIEREFDVAAIKARTAMLTIGGLFLLVVLLFCATIAKAQAAPSFTASVTTGPAPLSTVLTWSVPGATSCTAGNTPGWTGTVPASGSRTLTGIGADLTLTLSCTGPGKAVLSWTAPTQNTDGTAVGALAGYTVLYGPNASTLNQSVALNVPAATAYTIDPLATGSYAFAVRAKNAAGAESANSNVITKAVVGVSFSGSIPIDVASVPNAPVLTVAEVTAFEFNSIGGVLVGKRLPLEPVSINCAGADCTVLARRVP